ncbi:MAG: hypothetical protein OXH36_00395 [Bdellovibrionales bacterium]|nr:hypothetical protein [Bdellovibrionales bacterium]
MSGSMKNKIPSSEELSEKKNSQKQKHGYFHWWLFQDEGTVAEDWPTAQQLWENEEVQKEIKKVQEAFNYTEKEQK